MTTRKRILLVDDEASFTRMLKLHLESTDAYEVVIENEGTRAVATARRCRPDVIFLDVIMPAIDGGQIAAEIRSEPKLKDTPIIFLTAVVSKNEVYQHGDVIGGQTFLAKPVSVADVIGAIESAAA